MDEEVPTLAKMKYLGVIFDQDYTFVEEARRRLDLLRSATDDLRSTMKAIRKTSNQLYLPYITVIIYRTCVLSRVFYAYDIIPWNKYDREDILARFAKELCEFAGIQKAYQSAEDCLLTIAFKKCRITPTPSAPKVEESVDKDINKPRLSSQPRPRSDD